MLATHQCYQRISRDYRQRGLEAGVTRKWNRNLVFTFSL